MIINITNENHKAQKAARHIKKRNTVEGKKVQVKITQHDETLA